MFGTNLLVNFGYPYGVAIYEVTFYWRWLPDSVKDGESDLFEFFDEAVRQELGKGDWIVFPVLHEGIWKGLYVPYSRDPGWYVDEDLVELGLESGSSGPTAPPCETPLDEE